MTQVWSQLDAYKTRFEQDPVWFSRYVLFKTVVVLMLILVMSAWSSQNVVYQAF